MSQAITLFKVNSTSLGRTVVTNEGQSGWGDVGQVERKSFRDEFMQEELQQKSQWC